MQLAKVRIKSEKKDVLVIVAPTDPDDLIINTIYKQLYYDIYDMEVVERGNIPPGLVKRFGFRRGYILQYHE